MKKNGVEADHRIGVSREAETIPGTTTPVEALVVGVVISIVLSMLVGFYLGFKVAGCRQANAAAAEHPYLESTSTLPNWLSSGEHTSCCCRPHSTNVLPTESSTRIMWQPTVSPPRWQGKAPLCRDSSRGPG